MAGLVYSAITSLDGCVADAEGHFDWAAPDEEVHAFVNDLERRIGTYLYGRRMYEVMAGWQTMPTGEDQPAVTRDFAEIWRAADKVVHSTRLEAVTTPRTTLVRAFEPAVVQRLKDTTARDVSVGGPHLAAAAFRAGLVDDVHLFVNPVVVGGGLRALPEGVRLHLGLVDEHRFAGGVVHLHYRVSGP